MSLGELFERPRNAATLSNYPQVAQVASQVDVAWAAAQVLQSVVTKRFFYGKVHDDPPIPTNHTGRQDSRHSVNYPRIRRGDGAGEGISQ